MKDIRKTTAKRKRYRCTLGRLAMNSQKLLIVCDDAGFASVDRGIIHLAEQANAHVCAEYLIEVEGAAERAKAMSEHPFVSVGLHFELSGMSDADRVAMSRDLQAKGTSLGEQAEIQRKARDDACRQLTATSTSMQQARSCRGGKSTYAISLVEITRRCNGMHP